MRIPSWRHPVIVDGALIAVALADSATAFYWGDPGPALLAVVAALGLIARRRAPWVALLVALPALFVLPSTLAVFIAVYSVTMRARRSWEPVLASALVFALSHDVWLGGGASEVAISVVYAFATAVAPAALGLLVRTRRELAARVEELEEARRIEDEHRRDEILTTERARLAREMHDVVSHQVSLIAVQAGALQVATADDAARESARTIRRAAVRTLDELRQMVAVLRADGGSDAAIAPQPTLGDLTALVEDSQIPAEVRVDLPASLPPAVQRAIYRMVQEALTNIRKHAPGAEARIDARMESSEVIVTVSNMLTEESRADLSGARTGLIGLRERAELADGTLSVERGGGTFALVLRLPVPRTGGAPDRDRGAPGEAP